MRHLGPRSWRGNMFACIVCGASTRGRSQVFGSRMGPVALCGAHCCRVFLMDPLKYEVPQYEVPAEEQELVVTD